MKKSILTILFFLFFSISFGQFHLDKDLKFLIKTYPNGEYLNGSNSYRVTTKSYVWYYFLVDDKVDNITLVCFGLDDVQNKDIKDLKNSLLLKSYRLPNGKFYYNDESKNISFAWCFASEEELETRRDYINEDTGQYLVDLQIIYISFY